MRGASSAKAFDTRSRQQEENASALDQRLVVLAFANGVLEFLCPALARVNVGEQEKSERLQIWFLRSIESGVRERLHFAQLSRTSEKNFCEQQICARILRIFFDEHAHLFFRARFVACSQQKI